MSKENNKNKKDASSGEYVKKSYASNHPKTTQKETTTKKSETSKNATKRDASTGQYKNSKPKDGTQGIIRKKTK